MLRMRITVVLSLTLLMFSMYSPVSAGGTIAYGDTIYSRIDNATWQEFWIFYGSAGDQIEVVMSATSGDLDPWLTLWSDDGSGNLKFLAVDDDGAGGSNAMLKFTLPAAGTYHIEATRHKDRSGTTAGGYELSLRLANSGGSGGNQDGEPHDNWDEVARGCPPGFRCINSVATRWDRLEALTYCMPGVSGIIKNVGGTNVTIWSDTSFEQDFNSAVSYWQNLLSGLRMTQVDCSNSPNFIFGLIAQNDLIAVTGNRGIRGVSYPADPPPGIILQGDHLIAGNDRASTIAHELGHGLGLGHSQYIDTIMYPNHSNTTPPLANILLGVETSDSLASAYPTYFAGSINNTGYTNAVMESVNGNTAYESLAYPQGANRVLAACFIESYIAKDATYGDDADLGWSCNWQFDQANRKVNFSLIPHNSSEGKLRASILVLNMDVFTVHKIYKFRAYGTDSSNSLCIGGTEYDDYSTNTPLYNIVPSFNMPPGAIPLVSVTKYNYDIESTDQDDDMSFSVIPQANTFTAAAWRGCGYAEGWVNIISPANANASAQNCWMSVNDNSSRTVELWNNESMIYGQTQSGSINNANWNDYWYFNGASGDQVSITMRNRSGDLDPWLTLWWLDGSGNWAFVTSDDDSAGGSDSLLQYTLQNNGRYRIETTRLNDMSGITSGNYVLDLKVNQWGSGERCQVTLTDEWNNAAFTSLVNYETNDTDYFSTSNTLSDNGNILKSNLWARDGEGSGAYAWYEVIVLKTR